ncbi:hypothetical protein C8R45DRAFT_189922 [Mycena sanguinolenta]|nr:hypothetical protein C8R45DRAFT_189922 [Mycena sanguinolenta]
MALLSHCSFRYPPKSDSATTPLPSQYRHRRWVRGLAPASRIPTRHLVPPLIRVQRLSSAPPPPKSAPSRRLCAEPSAPLPQERSIVGRKLPRPRKPCPTAHPFRGHVPSITGRLSLSHLIFSPQQQPLALSLDFTTEYTRTKVLQDLADADSTMAVLPLKMLTVTFFCRKFYPEGGANEKLVDVSDEFRLHMPQLTSKLGGTGALCILEKVRMP